MDPDITQAIAAIQQARVRLEHALATTRDERLSWSPAPTARNILHLAAHAAAAVANIHGFMDGRPFTTPTPAEAERDFRAWEQQFHTRVQVLALIATNFDAYVEWLKALDPAKLDEMVETPFGMGAAPIRLGITFPPAHTHEHCAQINYIQTVYGDLDWHMG